MADMGTQTLEEKGYLGISDTILEVKQYGEQ